MDGNYILIGQTAVEEPDLLKWAKWFEENQETRIVKQTTIPGGLWLSTVFLGLDYRYGGGPPLLFETMLFRDGEGDECWRDCTWLEAEARHRSVLESLGVTEPAE